MKKHRNLILKVFVSVTLLSIIFSRVDKEMFLSNFRLLDLRFAPLIILFLIANYTLGAFRWKALLIHDKEDKISVRYLIYLYFSGAFFNNFMPTSIGGDVYKVYKLGRKMDNTVDAFSATFMERFTGVLALIIISIVSLFDLIGFWSLGILVLFVAGFFAGLWFLGFASKKFAKLKKIYDSLMMYRGQNRVLVVAFLTSFLIQFIAIFTQYFVFLAIGEKLPLLYSMFILPVITLAGFVIPSLNGVGVQDALYMRFFAAVGVPEALSLSASIIYHLFRLGVSLIGGVIYALGKDS